MVQQFITKLDNIEINRKLQAVNQSPGLIIRLTNTTESWIIIIDGNDSDVEFVIEQLISLGIIT